jgi:hypothetical protein
LCEHGEDLVVSRLVSTVVEGLTRTTYPPAANLLLALREASMRGV